MNASIRFFCPRTLLAAAVLASPGCAGARGASAEPASPRASSSRWSYEVSASPGARELQVTATFTGETDSELTVEEGGEPFLKDVVVEQAGGSYRLEERNRSWFLRDACQPRCVVRYRFELLAAARASDDVSVARLGADAIVSPPSTWLLRPARAVHETPFTFHVATAPGEEFVSGVFPDPAAPGSYAGKTDDHYQLAYAAFGKLRVRELLDGQVELALLPGPTDGDDVIAAWVEASARAVKGFYGRFPVRRLLVIARPTSGTGSGFGTTMGHSGAAIAIDVGARSSPADLAGDWVLVHEMVHTALPDLEGPQHWLEEGLATYVEPLVRRKAGQRTTDQLWNEWIEGMPNGLPAAGDKGLDATPTWGRTYWGGALFCLLADVEIRRRTSGSRSLGDALRAIVAASRGIADSWTIDQVIDVGDRAVGVPVLKEEYARMAHAPAPVDLPELWGKLGLSVRGGKIAYDDAAPLAAVRRGITDGR